MAIESNLFGRLRLSGDDAEKFKRQVRFGRPKANAKDNIAAGVELVKEMRRNGDCLRFSAER